MPMRMEMEVHVPARHLAGAHARVCVLGNAAVIGKWDSRDAVPMQQVMSENGVSTWKTQVEVDNEVLATPGFPLEYKYVVKDMTTDEVLSWEALPGNRTLSLTTACNVARDKPVKQSSTHMCTRMPCPGPRAAALGNDGHRNGFYESRCCRTTRELHPWWAVDLEQDFRLQTVNIWKALTYHAETKRPDACPPLSMQRQAVRTSSLPPPLAWVFVSTKAELFEMDGDALLRAAHAKSLPPETNVFALELHQAQRVETLDLRGVQGRYVRLQYEGMSELQFAELEVFTASEDDTAAQPICVHDGFYGVESEIDGKLLECVDSDWVDPATDNTQVCVSIGSFREQAPAIQWLAGERATSQPRIHVELQYLQRADDASKWEHLSVDARCALLQDKQSKELISELDALTKLNAVDLTPYVNSSVSTSAEWFAWLQATGIVSDQLICNLREHLTQKTFTPGEVLLHFAEHRRTAFFIVDGDVEIRGPDAAIGRRVLGSVSAQSSFNDLALFSQWPTLSAEFAARSDVVTECLTFEMLLEVLGVDTFRALREHLLRERAKKALLTAPTESKHFVDAEHTQVFRFKIPTDALSAAPQSSKQRLLLQFFDDQGNMLGTAPILPSQFLGHGEGSLSLPILSTPAGQLLEVIGQVTLQYLVIRPFSHPANNLSSVWRPYWRSRNPLNGGHRGMGRSYYQVNGFRKALTRENTLTSFLLAGRSGADFVEFDVQLTKDHVPMIYHDFVLRVNLEDKDRGKSSEDFDAPIHTMTYRQLSACRTGPVPPAPSPQLKQRLRKHWSNLVPPKQNGTRPTQLSPTIPVEKLAPADEQDDEHLVAFFPKLEQVLKHVPPEVGLNIEFKYPDQFRYATFRSSPSFEMNYYVDTILRCIFDNAQGRRIYFSCFDPTLCSVLRAKQVKYPVFFLTFGRVHSPVFDARLTLQFAVNFAKMEHLGGIVSNSDAFIATPACVELVQRRQLVLLTWGDQNTSYEAVQSQKQHGVSGIISDNIGDLHRREVAAHQAKQVGAA